jgi:hypothetical protein
LQDAVIHCDALCGVARSVYVAANAITFDGKRHLMWNRNAHWT